ncbi:hypothetical protein [Dactylosporangium sp. CA-139066]|uniref:hypothetical protein n=1 Tax=Dactylosporangium sp. CA-139066 TaxID=3239930 RepID=UPI003D91D462
MSPLLLVAFAAALALLGAPRLAAAGWVARAPGLGVAAWLALSAAIVLSALLAASGLLLYCGSELGSAWHALRGRAGHIPRTAALLGSLALLLIAARMTHSARRVHAAHRGTRSRLRLLLRLAGARTAVPGATVVPHPEPAAYLVPVTPVGLACVDLL